MCGSTPSAPPPPPIAPEAPTAANTADGASGEAQRRNAAARAASRSGTLLSGARGLTNQASTAPKTLLGS